MDDQNNNPTPPSDQGGQTPPPTEPAQPGSGAPTETCVTCGNAASACTCPPSGGSAPMGGDQPQGSPAI